MSDRSPNHHRTTRRATDRATIRAIRKGTLDAGVALTCPVSVPACMRGIY